MEKIKVGIDLDDTIWDLIGAWLKTFNEISGDNLKPDDIKSWDIASYINKGNKDMLFYILEQPYFWKTVIPNKEAEEYLKRINDKYQLYIITAANYKTATIKIKRFLELFPFIKDEQIIITSHKELINVDVLIDDCYENLQKFNKTKILITKPHNQLFNEEEIGATRSSDLKETYVLLKGELNARNVQ